MYYRQRSGMGIDGENLIASDFVLPYFGWADSFSESHNATPNHDLHRMRRKPMDLFFSRQSIERIEPMVAEEIKLLDDRLMELGGTGTVVNLEHAYAAITGDIIGQICSETHVSLVQEENFSPQWYVSCMGVVTRTEGWFIVLGLTWRVQVHTDLYGHLAVAVLVAF